MIELRGDRRRKLFLGTAWAFVAFIVAGTIVGSLASLPASNGQHGNTHNVVGQAVYGNGTALSPPLFITIILGLCVLAATRSDGWIGRVGALVTFLFAGFFVSAGELGELTTNTSPLSGVKWDMVLVLGSVGIAVAALTALAWIWMIVGAIMQRSRGTPGPAGA